MRRFAGAAILIFGWMVLSASASFAAGFRLPDQDAAAMGMAGAFAGQADDPAAVWYNPAAIVRLDGTQVAAGAVAIYPVLTHENDTVNAGTTDVSKRMVHLPVQLYGTRRVSENVAFGVGVNSPFGLSTDWDARHSSTRYVSTYTKVVTTEVNPNIAYALDSRTSLAFGIAYVQMRATLEKVVNVVLPGPVLLGDHNFRLSGQGDGWGFNAAVLHRVSDSTQVGLTYRSRIKVALSGDASLTGGPAAMPATGATSITLPDLVQAGVSTRVTDRLTFNADIDYTLWSTYDRIVVTSGNPLFNAIDEKQWHDVWCLRAGGEYRLADGVKLRGGYVYDKSPVGSSRFDTTTPDADRQGLTVGAGYAAGSVTVDLAYMYLHFNKRTIDSSLADRDLNPLTPDGALNGTYRSLAHIAAVTVGYRF